MVLSQNPVIQKSLRRLRSLGLKVYITDVSEDECVIVVDGESIIDTVKRLMSKAITYQKFYIHFDRDSKTLVTFFWRGETPAKVKALQFKMYEEVKPR